LVKVGKVRLSALLRARHHTIPGLETRKSLSTKGTDDPKIFQLGPSLYDACKELPELSRERKHVLRVALAYHSTTIRKLEQTGAPLYAPTEFGGWGVPHPKGDIEGWRRTRAVHRKAVTVALTSRPEDRRKYLGALKQHHILSAPSDNEVKTAAYLTDNIRKMTIVKGEENSQTKFRIRMGTPTEAGLQLVNLSDFETMVRGQLGAFTSMLIDSDRHPKPIRYQVRTSAKRSNRNANRISSLWASAKPLKLTTARKILERYCRTEYVALPDHRAWNALLHGKGWRLPSGLSAPPRGPQAT
jgi:hypothetical protein